MRPVLSPPAPYRTENDSTYCTVLYLPGNRSPLWAFPMNTQDDGSMNDAAVRSFADSTTMLLVSRVGMALGIPVIMSMMVWVLSSVNSMQIDIGIMKTQIAAGVEDRYHATDAAKDFALRDARILQNAQDISALKDRMEDRRSRR